MNIVVTYRRLGCLWDFAQHLSGWHFSYRENEREAWLKQTGPLSQAEATALKSIARIGKKYNPDIVGRDDNWQLDRCLITRSEHEAWKSAAKLMKSADFAQLKHALDILEPRFTTLWQEDESRLDQRKRLIVAGLNSPDSTYIPQLFRNFFAPDVEPQTVAVFLLMNANSHGIQGGANLGPGQITLRCSRTERFSYTDIAGTIWHEIAHLYQQERYLKLERAFLARIRRPKLWTDTYPTYSALREATASAISDPYGYVSKLLKPKDDPEKYYGKNFELLNPTRLYDWGYGYAPTKLQNITKQYVGDSRAIDDNYLMCVLEAWSDYSKLCAQLVHDDLNRRVV